MTKAVFLEHFAALNRRGITREEATAAALRAEAERDFRSTLPGGITVGLSSGTSGARHVFLVSRAERCRWAGQMLARMLGRASLRRLLNPFAEPLRIAFFLRADSNLYETVASRRVAFAYFDLTRPFGALVDALGAFRPHILVAPATVLAELARRRKDHLSDVRPSQVLSVAEVLDARDRALVEEAFGVRVAEVYQATEGFLGSSCEAGRVHLHEDALHVEPRWMDVRRDRFQPVVTDFSRRTQWFVRYHLDDVLRLDETPCPCGRATRSLRAIEGRAEEVLWLPDADGRLAPVFPDVLRQALYALPEAPGRYRVAQQGMRWEVRLGEPTAASEAAVRSALVRMVEKLGLQPPEVVFLPWTDQPPGEKQKRIRCLAPPA